jgi:hypothetical protein
VNKQIRDKGSLQKTLQENSTSMIRGSIVKLKGKCGKPNCACSQDREKEHIRYYLSVNEAGKTRMIYIPKKRLPEVEAGIRAWKSFKKVGKELADINLAMALQEK